MNRARRIRSGSFGTASLLGLAVPAFIHCSSTSDDRVDEAPQTVAECPSVGTPKKLATVTASELGETSGIAASALNHDVFWVHNDSGDRARAFAIGRDGALRATLAFDVEHPIDVEDMAIEDASPGRSWLYFGDIGDNFEERSELVIHRVAEPKLGASLETLTVPSEKMRVVYADHPHNAETLLFDPLERALFVVTKKEGGPAGVHRVGPFVPGGRVTLEKVASLDVDLATGGAIARDGRRIVVRNYGKRAWLWTRRGEESIAAALTRAPCALPIADEPQGEAFTFLPAGEGYVTVSEGHSPDLHVTLFQP